MDPLHKMAEQILFPLDSAVALRQPKTDRLILARFLKDAAEDKRLDESVLRAAHAVLVKWANLETSGRLGKLNESQMQGDFLAQVFGEALAYAGPLDGKEVWHREQHFPIGGETPDAVLGFFRQTESPKLRAVIELKGPRVHLDRHRSSGRTAVGQCWDYLVNTPPECRWGIVSNLVSFRLYERTSTKRAYEHFTLQSLRDFDVFKQFYVLFHRQGLIDESLLGPPRAVVLLKKSAERQQKVSDELYEGYSHNRTNLIAELHFNQNRPLDEAIDMAQRLFDRVMFIAFCEDRQLLPEKTIPKAYTVAGFYAVTNPRWQNFKNLFRFIDAGDATHGIPQYNGGLFAPHAVDELELPDAPWTTFFHSISTYDFADEVNLDVLGHLFERSITELEKLRATGLFGGDAEKARQYASMPQSAKRKQLGIYYTPPELTSRIVQYTVDELIAQRFAAAAVEFGISEKEARRGTAPDDARYWRRCLGVLRNLKIVDPACGSGAFLFQAYDALEARYNEVIGHLDQLGEADARKLAQEVATFILRENLYGVDLSPEAVEITQLALWIRSASPGQLLAKLSDNIVHGNSLVHDPEVHAAGFDWRTRFPDVFNREEAGFDCVIGNPPWERVKLQEREFFSLPAPEIATATNAAKRRQLVAKLESGNPALHERYQQALAAADLLLTYCRKSDQYPLTGKGDINTYAVFAELAYRLVAPHGRVGLLVPSGIASDMTTKDFFAAVAEAKRLIRLFDFENRLKTFFPEVDGRFKFSILNFGGEQATTTQADYVFFAHRAEELEDRARHIALSGADIRLLNPNTRTCPIFHTRRDADITKGIYRRVPILIDMKRAGPTGNPWGIQFKRMFDQTNDAELFREADTLKADGFKLKGNRWIKGKQVFLPVYEAKMLQDYDHRAADVVTDKANWMRQGQTEKRSLVSYQNPENLAMPRFWVDAHEVETPEWGSVGFKDITSPTNQRTMIAACAPMAGFTNHFVLVRSELPPVRHMCLLANLNAVAYDYCTRQKIGGVTLNFFIVEQIPTLPPEAYDKPCLWDRRRTLETWISQRVLKLTCTAEDMLPLADACGFTGGSFQAEYGGRLHKWDEAERAELMAELDAAFFHLYSIERDDVEYILSTFKGIHDQRTLFPGASNVAERIVQKYVEMAG
ncbi:MAG: Eco57I restriction-modification methylase domain-containing protein [Pirellulales bacterium]